MTNDRERFEAVWRAHHSDVLAFVRRRVADADLAQDIVAEAFLVAWRRADELPVEARPWLFGVARLVLANARRSERRRQALTARLQREPTLLWRDEPPAPGTLADDVARAFASLSADDRDVLRLVAWDELTPGQAAHVLGISAPRFSVRLHRAKRRLKARTEALGMSTDRLRSTSPLEPLLIAGTKELP